MGCAALNLPRANSVCRIEGTRATVYCREGPSRDYASVRSARPGQSFAVQCMTKDGESIDGERRVARSLLRVLEKLADMNIVLGDMYPPGTVGCRFGGQILGANVGHPWGTAARHLVKKKEERALTIEI